MIAETRRVQADIAERARLDRAARARWSAAVQRQPSANRNGGKDRVHASEPSLLSGLLLDENGERLTPTHASKAGVRHRSYVLQALIAKTASEVRTAWRLPAGEIEALVLRGLRVLLSDHRQMMGLVADDTSPERIRMVLARAADGAAVCGSHAGPGEQRVLVRGIVERVKVYRDRIEIAWRPADLAALLTEAEPEDRDPSGWTETLSVPVTFRERGIETRRVIRDGASSTGQPDRTLPRRVRGARWWEADGARPVRRRRR